MDDVVKDKYNKKKCLDAEGAGGGQTESTHDESFPLRYHRDMQTSSFYLVSFFVLLLLFRFLFPPVVSSPLIAPHGTAQVVRTDGRTHVYTFIRMLRNLRHVIK